MNVNPLNERELKRLAKMDRKLSRGFLAFGLIATAIGVLGGLAWVGLMLLAAPGFGQHMNLRAPTGNEQHAMLEQTMYWLVTHLGALPGICVMAGGMFGAMAGGLSVVLWPLLVSNHTELARRALAHGQFQPRFLSGALRRGMRA